MSDTRPVLACDDWPTNSLLIADVAKLWIKSTDCVLDVTYGRGLWWEHYQPERFTFHDIRIDGVDFRKLPEADQSIDVIAFDPPYVSVGGRHTSSVKDMHDRYGLTDAPGSPDGVQALINDGLTETARVVKRGGIILVKCQDYVSSGKLFPGTFLTTEWALRGLGLKLVDRFEHRTWTRPQPAGRRQVHARRNISTLLVFKSQGDKRGNVPSSS